MKCKIDHGKDGLPKHLCRVCNPKLGNGWKGKTSPTTTAFFGSKRDFNQPKGMSDDEWTEIKRGREVAAQEKKVVRLERLKEIKANAPKRKSKREGLVSVIDIAKELGMVPREARAILRSVMAKPAGGWAFTPGASVNDVKSALRKGAGIKEEPAKKVTPKIKPKKGKKS